MKKLTKILSLSLAFMLSLATAIPTVSVAADPEPTGSITITSYKASNYTGDEGTPPGETLTGGSLEGRTFVAYRILNGKTTDNVHVGYTIPDAMVTFYQNWDWDSTTPNTGIEPVAANNMLRIAEVDDVSTSQQSVVQSDNAMSGIDIMKAIANLDGQVQFVGPVESSDSGIMLMDALTGKTGDDLNEAVLEHLNGMTTKTDELYAFANSALAYAEKAAATPKYSSSFTGIEKTGTSSGTVEFTNLPYGYYVIGEKNNSDTPGEAISTALLTAIHTNSEITIVTKDVAPTVNKFITNDTNYNLDSGDKKNSAEIGDTVNFKIVANLPDVQGYSSYTYTVKDTFSAGLDFDDDTGVKVYFYPKKGDSASAIELTATGYNDDPNGGGKYGKNPIKTATDGKIYTYSGRELTIEFSSDWILKNGIHGLANKHEHTSSSSSTTSTGADIDIPYIVITYSAKVNSSATIGGTGNVNSVGITYSNDPSNSSSTTTTPPNTKESTTTTYVYGVDLYKTGYVSGAIGSKEALEGATFKLKNKNTGNNQGKYAKLSEDSDTHTYTLTGWDDIGKATPITSTKNPDHVRINGLEAGDYEFEEISAPTGYEPIKGDGAIAFTITATDPAKPSFSGSGDSSLVTVGESGTTGVGNVTVENIIDGLLPGTGGVGRVMVYALGSILVLGAAVLFVLKRRSGKNA